MFRFSTHANIPHFSAISSPTLVFLCVYSICCQYLSTDDLLRLLMFLITYNVFPFATAVIEHWYILFTTI